MNIQKLRPRLSLLCKIFLIGLLIQFFLQTFVTFQLGRDGTFWSAIWMWKEFILLIFVIAIIYAIILKAPEYIKTIQSKSIPLMHAPNEAAGKGDKESSNNKEEGNSPTSRSEYETSPSKEGQITLHGLRACFKQYSIVQFTVIFIITTLIFFLIAIGIQKVGLGTFILSFKYDLLPFFIFGVGACLAFLFFSEENKDIFHIYKKLIIFSLWAGILRRGLVYIMPNALKFFGFDPFTFEGTIGSRPPAAYYTLISPNLQGSYVRNGFIFERPISFGFWLIAFFPVFALAYLRKKPIKKQIGYSFLFGILVLSTRSRAAIGVFGIEIVALALIIHRKHLRKYLRLIITLGIIGGAGVLYYGNRFFAREHSNTGHLMLIVEGRNLTKDHLITGRGAGYSGPASHQLCYTPTEVIDIFVDQNEISHPNPRCEAIRKVNIEHQISTYGYNPENQYLQILMEYGLVGLLFWLLTLCWILYYTIRTIQKYRKTEKSNYQQLLYYSLIGFGIGLLGLCAEGMVLHSLVDRMVVYPFFLLYGLTLGLREREKDIPFIEAKKEKKKKTKTSKKEKKADSKSQKTTVQKGSQKKKGKKKSSKKKKK